jgi:hypothetical protein
MSKEPGHSIFSVFHLKMAATDSIDTLVPFHQATQRHIPEDSNFHNDNEKRQSCPSA